MKQKHRPQKRIAKDGHMLEHTEIAKNLGFDLVGFSMRIERKGLKRNLKLLEGF